MNMQALKQAANNKFKEAQQATVEGLATVQNKAIETGEQVNDGMNNLKQSAESTVQGARAGVGNAIEAQKAQHVIDSQHQHGKFGAGLERVKNNIFGEEGFIKKTIPEGVEKAKNEFKVAKVAAAEAHGTAHEQYSKTDTPKEATVEEQQLPGQQLPQGGRRRRRKRRKSKRWPRKKSKSKRKKSRRRRKKKGGKKSRKKKRRRSRKKSRRRRRR